MKAAFYIGDHRQDGALSRLGVALTRLAQKGPFGDITHVEAIHLEHADGAVRIASASLRDGGVRAKDAHLVPGNWRVVDVPRWDVELSIDLLHATEGARYDWRGALATCLPGSPQDGRYFCNQWVALPYLRAAATFGPHHLFAIALTLGRDVTDEFFQQRQATASTLKGHIQ